jgi:hypothetical protein
VPPRRRRGILVTILSGALILLAALMLCVGGLALVYRFVPVSLLQAHYVATGAIYAALYVMFGISLGFSLFLVWQQYEAARLTVQAEAAALQRIYWMAENFPDPKRSNVQELAVSYARGEVQEEWPLMGKGRVSPQAEQRASTGKGGAQAQPKDHSPKRALHRRPRPYGRPQRE